MNTKTAKKQPAKKAAKSAPAKAAKKAAPAVKKTPTPKPAPKPAAKRSDKPIDPAGDTQNGVTRPKPGSKAAALFNACDSMRETLGRPPARFEVLAWQETAPDPKPSRDSAALQYHFWRKYNGLEGGAAGVYPRGEIRKGYKAKPAPETSEPAQKANPPAPAPKAAKKTPPAAAKKAAKPKPAAKVAKKAAKPASKPAKAPESPAPESV